MPYRNLNIIFLAACVSLLCYAVQQRAKTAMMVGDALNLIDSYYVDPVDHDDLLTAAMDGITSSLDEHSEFIPQQDYESFQDSIHQEFAGIGIYVEPGEPGQPVRVVTPLVGSPALEAGILPGDRIVRIDGVDVSTMSLREVSSRLKGQIGTSVALTLQRGDEQIPTVVRRGRIELESVIGDHRNADNRWIYRLAEDPKIAYLRITSFGDKTVMELEDVLKQLDNQFDSLVIDLRGNGGGLLHAAVDISDMFLDRGVIVSTRTRGGKLEERFDAQPGTLVDASKPIAILIDHNSASASEIVAAALQDHHRAMIVGTRSYGKGTVQNILPLQYGRSALRLTVARYYRPNGKDIHRRPDATEDDPWGVLPDPGLTVELDEATMRELANRWRQSSYPALALADSAVTPVIESDSGDDADSDPAETDSPRIYDPSSEQPQSEQPQSLQQGPHSDPEKADEPQTDPTPADTPAELSTKPLLELDSQLRRAVESLREKVRADLRRPTAA